MAARRTPPRRGVSGDCAQTDGAASREPIANATSVTSVIGHLPNDDPAVSAALEFPGTIRRGLTATHSGTRSGIRRRCYGTPNVGGSDETRTTSRGRPRVMATRTGETTREELHRPESSHRHAASGRHVDDEKDQGD